MCKEICLVAIVHLTSLYSFNDRAEPSITPDSLPQGVDILHTAPPEEPYT